ncbi:C39 family peptidase (plasmid) [Burkholderia pyrrocinia]|uniref:C39 family peptidase n=1 Tax=Burkholderia pyrrocinia TaxID=60550 RepID=UPI0038B556BF
MKDVPFYAQWESRLLVDKFLSRAMRPEDDPQWRQSGALSAEEYAKWSPNICGMACLKMILAYRFGIAAPLLHLVREAVAFGAYQPEQGDSGMRLMYRPFVELLRTRYKLNATVVEHTCVEAIEPLVRKDYLFMASVHPTIRHAGPMMPPAKGGHLVLVFDVDHEDRWTFHNPSGRSVNTQEYVRLPRPIFDRFFANRGVLVAP